MTVRKTTKRASLLAMVLASSTALSAAGCGDSEDGAMPDAGPGDGDGDGEGPRYAIMYEIYDDVGSTSYLNVLDSLDIDAVDPSQGREFVGGRAFLEAYDGAIYVGDPTTPTVTRFTVSDAGELQEAGEVSFGNYALTAGVLDAWTTTFVSADKAYLFDASAQVMVIWDPTEMKILGEVDLPDDLVPEGLSLDGSPGVLRGNRLYRTFYSVDWDTAEYATEQSLAIFDTESDELLELVPETRCAASGNLLHEDEDGNVYFSNWIWPVSGAVLGSAPKNCVLRLPADEERFDDWTFTYADVFDGREGAMFTYVGDGTALVSVFHDDEVDYDDTTDPWELASNPAWHIWSVDLETGDAAPLEGVPANTGAFTPVKVGDRLFLMVPGEGWATTTAYEIVDGKAEVAFEIPGWSYQFREIR